MKYFILGLFLSMAAMAEEVKIQGQVIEMGSRKKLGNIKLFFLPEKKVITTNNQGEFEISLDPTVDWKLIINLAGYKKFEQKILIDSTKKIKVYLEKFYYNLFETTVVGKGSKRDLTKKSLTYEDFYYAPGAGSDPIKAVANLPGVNRSSRGAQVIIQGGAPDDTQYGVNQIYVPLAFHFGGLTSVIMPEAIQEVDYLSAGYGPEYGKAISGVINLNTRKPRTDRYYGIGQLDIFNGGLLLEGPINEDTSFLVSTRRSWIGEVLKAVAEGQEGFDFTVAPSYTDVTTVVNHQFSKKKRLSVTGLYSLDTLEFILDMPIGNDPTSRGDFQTETGFHRVITRYEEEIDKDTQWFSSFSFGKDKIFFKVNELFLDVKSNNYNLRAEYSFLKYDIKNFFGIDSSLESYDTGINLPVRNQDDGGVNDPFSIGNEKSGRIEGTWWEVAFYNRHEWSPNFAKDLLVIPSLRTEYYSSIESNKERWKTVLFQPRLSLKYSLDEWQFFKSGLGVYYQLPEERELNDLLGNPNLKALAAHHLSFGYENDFRKGSSDGHKIYSGVFYKDLKNLVDTSSEVDNINGELVYRYFDNTTQGRIFGGEIYWQFANDSWKINTSYTLLRSYQTELGKAETLSEFDQTHNVNFVASYTYERWVFSTRLRYVTGNPRTPVVGSVFDTDNDVYIPVRGQFFSERNEAFLQLDLRVDRKFIFNDWILSAYFDVQNVTNRKNPEGLNYSYDFSQSEVTSGLPVLPTFGIKGEF